MSRLALIDPTTLTGEALRELIAAQADRWDQIELFTTDEEEVGAVTEVAGRAALVQDLDPEILTTLDVALFCGHEIPADVLSAQPGDRRWIFVDPEYPVPGATAIVAGLNEDEGRTADRLVSPAPAVLLVSHLLAPLRRFGSLEAVAHVLLPASARGKAALDELFEQTRSILSMSEERPETIFGTQLSFNLLPWNGVSPDVDGQLEAILGPDVVARVHLSQAGVFHGCSGGVFVRTSPDVGANELEDALGASPWIERSEESERLGPVSAATSRAILISGVKPSPRGGYWFWSCMDNLTASAQNALSLATL